jgi:hypothetical protein
LGTSVGTERFDLKRVALATACCLATCQEFVGLSGSEFPWPGYICWLVLLLSEDFNSRMAAQNIEQHCTIMLRVGPFSFIRNEPFSSAIYVCDTAAVHILACLCIGGSMHAL